MNQKATILVVDDSHVNLKVLIDYLTHANFRVLVATQGLTALQQAQRLPPDLILMDVMMPEMDGFETCRRLKALDETREVPVIFMTALSEINNKARAFEAGAVDYVTKPFQQEEVLMRINTHLTLQRQKKELRQLNEQLAELNAAKNRFFSIIAHDLKGAFTPLLSYSQLLIESVELDNFQDIKQVAYGLQSATRSTFKLLENLLSWARLQSGMVELQPRLLDLCGLVEETLQFLQTTAQQKEISLSHAVDPEILAYADPNMVSTVLRNLISNALKFTYPGGSVAVSAHPHGDMVELVVADTGIGINSDYLTRLFRIDQSYRRAGTDNEKGTGLGLILCKELIEKNGGRIWAESQENQGASLHFTLPARQIVC
jgi:signal transduction histidine kinase